MHNDQEVLETHAWYMAEPFRTMDEAAQRLGITRIPLRNQFIRLGLPIKTRSDYAGKYIGDKANTWSGGRTITNEGYVKVRIYDDDPYYCMATKSQNYVLEHRYVMAQYLGRPLYDWETVHHNDGNRQNNDISNLQLRIGKHGKGQAYACMECGSKRIEPIELDT